MFAYKSNSPQYLDYIAANMTRQQIKDDPKLCVLLENEYIKDNMELAIRWNEAKHGDYQDKYNFAQYLMCNGPEVDADTILHYRTMALRDPVMMEIAYTYLTDVNVLIKLREQKYGKKSNSCFTNPCFYLGRFSAAIAEEADVKNTQNPYTWIGTIWKQMFDEKNQEYEHVINEQYGMSQTTAGAIGGAGAQTIQQAATGGAKKVLGASDQLKPKGGRVTSDGDIDDTSAPAGSFGSAANEGVIPMRDMLGWTVIRDAIAKNDATIFRNFNARNLAHALWMSASPDWKAESIQQWLSLNSMANAKRRMGDCSRMWQQVRNLRIFDGDNAFSPMTPDMKIDGVSANGMWSTLYGNSDPSAADVWKRLTTLNSIADDLKKSQKANG